MQLWSRAAVVRLQKTGLKELNGHEKECLRSDALVCWEVEGEVKVFS
jgi:hypothetical protein